MPVDAYNYPVYNAGGEPFNLHRDRNKPGNGKIRFSLSIPAENQVCFGWLLKRNEGIVDFSREDTFSSKYFVVFQKKWIQYYSSPHTLGSPLETLLKHNIIRLRRGAHSKDGVETMEITRDDGTILQVRFPPIERLDITHRREWLRSLKQFVPPGAVAPRSSLAAPQSSATATALSPTVLREHQRLEQQRRQSAASSVGISLGIAELSAASMSSSVSVNRNIVSPTKEATGTRGSALTGAGIVPTGGANIAAIGLGTSSSSSAGSVAVYKGVVKVSNGDTQPKTAGVTAANRSSIQQPQLTGQGWQKPISRMFTSSEQQPQRQQQQPLINKQRSASLPPPAFLLRAPQPTGTKAATNTTASSSSTGVPSTVARSHR